MGDFNFAGMAPTGMQFDMPKPKGGMFGGGDSKFGIGQAILAALNGYLASRGNPVGMANMQMMQQGLQDRRRAALEEEQYSRHRADQNSDWQSHYDYEAAHPRPQEPGEFEQRLMASGVQPGTPGWTEAMKAAVQNTTDPIVITPQGPMLRSQVMGALQPPTKPVGRLTPIDGGPVPQAPGGFPGY